MKISAAKRFFSDQFTGASNWFYRFLEKLNLLTEQIVDTLNGNLTIQDNLNSQVYMLSIKAGATATDNVTSFQSSIKGNPVAVIVGNVIAGYTAMLVPVQVFWSFDGKNVNVNSITGLTSGTTYTITLLVF